MSRRRLLALLLVGGYLAAAIATVDVNWERVAEGIGRGTKFLAAFLTPDFSERWTDISQGLLESLTMTVVATLAGLLLSLPIALGAARNLSPLPVYLTCRAIVTVSRAFHELIVAILFAGPGVNPDCVDR